MKNMNNKGFTLVELVATILILGLIMGIGGYSITNLIQKNKQNSYELLINEIKEALLSMGEEYIIVAKDIKTNKTFWLFEKTDNIKEFLFQ